MKYGEYLKLLEMKCYLISNGEQPIIVIKKYNRYQKSLC